MDHMSVLWCSHKWKPCYLDKIGGVFMHFSAKMRQKNMHNLLGGKTLK